jgi:ribonucleoside-diphosphate reductase alpha chain
METEPEAVPVMEQTPGDRRDALTEAVQAPMGETETALKPEEPIAQTERGPVFTGAGTPGLRFDRRWTTPGVHPYDEITWETRAASIQNEKGEAVFEQKDVEVPSFWSQLATNVVVSKYFRGHVGTPERERSVKQLIDRVVDTIAAWAETQRYFAGRDDLETFRAELTHLLVHQKMAFNSPVWFNVGIEERPQCSACFINSVQDNMSSIMDLAKTEAMLFKYGSGTGSNLSPLRSSKERMSGGGIASGPVSFMRGYDAFAGVIKSGGKTRRAAKMVILDADHPDIVQFINSKADEEKKAWALIEQGYDPSFTGEAYGSVYFQNANHSVRVTDDFMKAVERDGDWTTHEVTTGRPAQTYKARDLFRQMAEAAWICGDPGIQYDTTINDWHTSASTDRIYASNPCSEYMFLNDTACNLASLNLMKFVDADGEFDVEAYRYACKLTITAQEILVDNASYPTPRIEENSHKFRPLGLGYANLGALLMSRGLAYDSAEGRAFAAALTAIMTGEAYRQSAEIARDHGGPFTEYKLNERPFLRVIGKHREAAYRIEFADGAHDVIDEARRTWDEALELGRRHGYRNAQVTVLAPTGTIAFMMDCDTTGIEPDIALIKYKKLVGEGFLKIVNQTVPGALKKLGYSPEQVEEIVRYIDERETIEGAPGLKPEHLPVFDCAFKPVNGQRSIHYMGHVRMMSATQPFLSGAISKTVNMPEAATSSDIEQVYMEGWRLGLKAIAIYRDGSKRSQPLSTGKKKDAKESVESAPEAAKDAGEPKPYRRRLPAERQAVTHKFEIAGHEGYITVGLYPDGTPGEIFLKMAKEGSTVSGLMDSFATAISLSLQYGVPLRDLVNKFGHVRFEPAGFTGNQEIPIAKSIVDYIFRWLGSRFLPREDRDALGIISREEPRTTQSEAPAAETSSSDVSGASASSGTATGGSAGGSDDSPPPPLASASSTQDVSHGARTAGEAARVVAQKAATLAMQPAAGTVPPDTTTPETIEKVQPNKAELPLENGQMNGNGNGGSLKAPLAFTVTRPVAFQAQEDAPSCAECGSIMVRNGSCYKCLNCGSTSGCS